MTAGDVLSGAPSLGRQIMSEQPGHGTPGARGTPDGSSGDGYSGFRPACPAMATQCFRLVRPATAIR